MKKIYKKNQFSKLLKKLAKRKSIKQYELALVLGVSQSAISQMLNGKTLPSPKAYMNLKRFLMIEGEEEIILNELYTEIKTSSFDSIANYHNKNGRAIAKYEPGKRACMYNYDMLKDINRDDDFLAENLNIGNQYDFMNFLLLQRNILKVNSFELVDFASDICKDIKNNLVFKLETDYYSPYIPKDTLIFLQECKRISSIKNFNHIIVKFFNDNNIYIKIMLIKNGKRLLKNFNDDKIVECKDNIEWVILIKSYFLN
ncbi:helix-turn-helix transcriptional regulator [Lentisphaerota bacterium WC36G]|nr:helix-turn-helix domain-containing protein [Lentisphaerae bacterium WC36]